MTQKCHKSDTNTKRWIKWHKSATVDSLGKELEIFKMPSTSSPDPSQKQNYRTWFWIFPSVSIMRSDLMEIGTPREIWILKLELLRHPRVWNYRFLTFDYQYELYRSSGPWFLEIELQRMLQNSEVLSQVKSQSRKHQFGKLVNSTRTPIPVFWMVTSPELTIQNSVAFSGVLFLEIKALNSDRVHIDNPNLEFWDQSSNFSWGWAFFHG